MDTLQENKYYAVMVAIKCIHAGEEEPAREQLQRILSMYQNFDYSEQLDAYIRLAEEMNTLLFYNAQSLKVNFTESETLYRQLREQIRRCDSHSAIRTLLMEIVETYSGLIRTGSRRRYSNLIRNCLDYIDQHYAEPLTVTEEAKRLSVARSYLSHRFARELGCNFIAYVNAVRVHYACILLENLQFPIQRISESVGFSSSNYFARVFRQQMGMTPSQYRQSKQKRLQ